jgi:NAD(P)-dependent dehydrogenase (short-subunit alcohol dehydrogenase family)
MAGICKNRVVVITGAGRGLGREYALAFAQAGAKVVVNDLGGNLEGEGHDRNAADSVVGEIQRAGGVAIANHDDVADWEGAGRLISASIQAFGSLHTVINNAGILRLVSFEEETIDNWDRTIRVHLRGHFCVARHAVDFWRNEHEAGRPVSGRIINITSGAGLQGAARQAPYATAKGGIASLTLTQAAELGRYGVTANAIAPSARTRMTVDFWPDQVAKPRAGFDVMDPANIAPALVWLGSEHSQHVTGCVFEIGGGTIALADGWRLGPVQKRDDRWTPSEVGVAVDSMLSMRRAPRPVWNT